MDVVGHVLLDEERTKQFCCCSFSPNHTRVNLPIKEYLCVYIYIYIYILYTNTHTELLTNLLSLILYNLIKFMTELIWKFSIHLVFIITNRASAATFKPAVVGC